MSQTHHSKIVPLWIDAKTGIKSDRLMMSIARIQCRFLYSVTQRWMKRFVELLLDIHCYRITFWMENHRHLCIKLLSKNRFVQKKNGGKNIVLQHTKIFVIIDFVIIWLCNMLHIAIMTIQTIHVKENVIISVGVSYFVGCGMFNFCCLLNEKKNNQIQTFIFFESSLIHTKRHIKIWRRKKLHKDELFSSNNNKTRFNVHVFGWLYFGWLT